MSSLASVVAVVAFCAAVHISAASFAVPTLGTQTAGSTRADLKDRDFRIDFSRGSRFETSEFTSDAADVSTFPFLGAQDVQLTLARTEVKAGGSFISHLHPRATESFYSLQGRFRVRMRLDGAVNPRIVTNVIRQGEATVFPQGLIHEPTCISKSDCVFLSVLNSADAGTVPAPISVLPSMGSSS